MITPRLLPAERGGRPASPALAARRQAIMSAAAEGVWRTDLPPDETIIGGVRCLSFKGSDGVAGSGTVVHFHGGGFRQGCPEMAAPFAMTVANRCGLEVILPAYRLAPEHPFPTALTDGMAVIRACSAKGEKPLTLSGDSAGGGLAASLARLCAIEQLPLSGLMLLSPWLDLTVSSASYVINADSDPLFSRQSASEAAEEYLQGHPAHDPLASPLFAKMSRFPPSLISVGTEEVLVEDAFRLHAALRSVGVDAELVAVSGMEHTAAVRDPTLRGATETLDAVIEFIRCRQRGQSNVQSHRA